MQQYQPGVVQALVELVIAVSPVYIFLWLKRHKKMYPILNCLNKPVPCIKKKINYKKTPWYLAIF